MNTGAGGRWHGDDPRVGARTERSRQMADQAMQRRRVRAGRGRAHPVGGLVVRDEHDAVVGVVAGIRAVWSLDHCQQHDECRCNLRASLAESMEHRKTTVTIARGPCQVILSVARHDL